MDAIESMVCKYARRRQDEHDVFNFAWDVMDYWANETPAKVCLLSVSHNGYFACRVTFGEMSARSNQFAHALSRLGLQRFDRVMLLVTRQPEWYYALFGMLKVGVIPMPTTVMSRVKDIHYRINRAEACLVISDVEKCAEVEAVEKECPTLIHKIVLNGERHGWLSFDALMGDSSVVLHPWMRDADPVISAAGALIAEDRVQGVSLLADPMLLFFTSGTTGHPKMVRHSNSYSLGHAITAEAMSITPDDVYWALSDTGWAKTAWGKLFPQWLRGATVLQYMQRGRFDPEVCIRILQEFKATVFCGPPTVYRMLIRSHALPGATLHLRHATSAGEPLNPEVMAVWKKHTGVQIHEFYGQTETVCIVANILGEPVRPGSMGRPCRGIDVQLVDDDGKVVAEGEEGQIAIRIPRCNRPFGLFMDYWKDEQKTASVFQHGYYLTQDKATKDADGFFWYLGRADDVFKSSGYRVGPFEVESALLEHSSVVEAAVVGVPDPEGVRGLVVKAFVLKDVLPQVLANEEEASDSLVSALQEHVKAATAPYKYPRIVEFVKEIPKTISGKIRRNELRTRPAVPARPKKWR